jgi:hypothetical protein
MKSRQFLLAATTLAITLLLAVVGLVALDALLHLKHPATSFASRIYASLRPQRSTEGLTWPVLVDAREVDPYIEAMKASGVGLGNSPYRELKSDAAAINHVVDGCLEMKPNLHKTLSYMRSELFDNFDPLNYFYDTDAKLPADLQAFLDRYTFRKVHLTTDANGYRVTIPAVDSPDKIIVMGDSMGMSAMVDDNETLASQLQAADPKHQYINIGVGSAGAEDIVCNLERALKRYPGQVRGIIYPFSENDLHAHHPLGEPERMIPRLAKIKADNGVQDFAVIYMPYIYNVVPELTRIPGTEGYEWGRHGAERVRFQEIAAQNGFRHLDFTTIALAEQKATGSEYAPLALFIDHAHLSREGIHRLVQWLTAPPGGAS